MLTAIIITIILTILKTENSSQYYDTYGLVLITVVTILISVLVTLLTAPVGEERLKAFVAKCLPIGFWRGHVPANQSVPKFLNTFLMWILGLVVSFSGLFAIGHLLFGRYVLAVLLAGLSIASLLYLFRLMQKESKFFE